ncbi:hypothetical protein LZZ85_27525 [Terrimonas sp. NA20]|uniref:PA14 domain-containing protein n=1 Tax=Terrimonas ginsenosidimutans TaxID=2908004 RepID=A0ABS9L0U5_9BACT|nr:hypothetical protein [Terrimonas ginsenosidimutans]MCG2618084.1 hypothetical protein [Terrimonas ginsenosidimutans]
MLKNLLNSCILISLFAVRSLAQSCTPQGDEITFGTNDTWIGYVYDNSDLTNYKGYILQGTPGNPAFDQAFGGFYVNFPTNGCTVHTESFSVRYKLRKTFAPGDYDFNITGDDGYRLSIDGGITWAVNNWSFNGYTENTVTLSLNGTYDLVLEYYEYAHNNRITFQVSNACLGTGSTTVYGANNVWRGYVYNGTDFNFFKGLRNQGSSVSSDFDENFGGAYVRFNTSSCALLSEQFSVRYRLSRTFSPNNYSFIVGSEDGYRLSFDGGASWAIDNWSNTSYTSSNLMVNLNGAYNMVLEYREFSGTNRIFFSSGLAVVLPVELISFSARKTSSGILVNWRVGTSADLLRFEIERSSDGQQFRTVGDKPVSLFSDRYDFLDPFSPSGQIYYRLKILERSGKIYYSKPVIIPYENQGFKVFPTLVNNGNFYFANNQPLKAAVIHVVDFAGRPIHKYLLNDLAAQQTTSLRLPAFITKGFYFIKLEEAGVLRVAEKIYVQ